LRQICKRITIFSLFLVKNHSPNRQKGYFSAKLVEMATKFA
jgi:hypothetical protein